MASSTPTKIRNYGDAISIVINRAKIARNAHPEDEAFIKGVINEYHLRICSERRWRWRRFDRSYILRTPTTTGTAAVTQDAKTVTFTGLTVTSSLLGKSFQVDGDQELYRIVGYKVSTNQVFIENGYIGETDASATYKIFGYEFALPPDCDNTNQFYTDKNLTNGGEIDYVTPLEFNRMLARNTGESGPPRYWTEDGQIVANPTLDPLDVMIPNFDFLGGKDQDKVGRVRFFPINPDQNTLIHMSYCLLVEDLTDLTQKLMIPADNAWCLVHLALGEWWRRQGNLQLADREFKEGEKILKEMRAEQHKADPKPKFKVDYGKYRRHHDFGNREDIHYISRLAEVS